MGRHEVRYYFEHKLLPQQFYEDKLEFATVLLQQRDVLFEVIDALFKEESIVNPYSKEDFDISAAKLTDDDYMIRIGFPEPEDEPLCYCAFLFFDSEFEKAAYFCIEKGGAASQGEPFICSWTEDRIHHNYGNCSLDDLDNFKRCAAIYFEREYGTEREDDGE